MLEPTPFSGGVNDVPQFADLKKMWAELIVRTSPPDSDAHHNYVDALGTVYSNGAARVGAFLIEPHPVFDWFASRNQLHRMWFFEKIWSVDAVQVLMPESLLDVKFLSPDVFGETSPFLLGGSFAWALASGGAYEKHALGSVHAKQLGDDLAAEWIHDRYDEILVYESHRAWSAFFHDVAWDHTWIALDKRERLVHILCATDTD